MSLLDKLKKNSTIKHTDVLSKSEIYNDSEVIVTDIPLINIALSGSVDGGFKPSIIGINGESRHFKTGYALKIASSYLNKYKDAALLFIDTEFGSPQSYFVSSGIDPSRVIHVPITNIEEMTHELMAQLTDLSRGDKVIVVIDSIGNTASKREVDNSLDGKGTQDMTRAQKIKSMFRQITPISRMKQIPIIFINHVYKEMSGSPYAKTIVGGGQGPMLAADHMWIIGRSQEKDADGDLAGYNFTINIEKSRFVREKSKLPVTITFEGGINKYSGILDLALEANFVKKPSNGWFQLVDMETGEMIGTKVRAKDTETHDFLGSVLLNPKFNDFVKSKYQLSSPKIETTFDEEMESV